MPDLTKSLLEEQLRKREELSGMWPWRLLIFNVVFLALVFFIYAGAEFAYIPYLDAEIRKLDNKVLDLNREIDAEEIKNVVVLYSKISNIQHILANHNFPVKILQFLEKNILDGVYYNTADWSASQSALRLDGVAADYSILAKQLELFNRSQDVVSLSLENSSFVAGRLIFSLRITVSSNIYR